MRTRDLVEVSVGAVRGRVTAIASAPEPRDGGVTTYITLAVGRGAVRAAESGTLVLRERGGQVGGRQEWTFGSPRPIGVGERVLVFLSAQCRRHVCTRPSWRWASSTLHDASAGRARRASSARDVDGAGPHAPAPRAASRRTTSPLAALRAAIRGAAPHGRDPRRADPRAAGSDGGCGSSRAPLSSCCNPQSRWFEPDDGIPIGFRVDTTGDATLGRHRVARGRASRHWAHGRRCPTRCSRSTTPATTCRRRSPAVPIRIASCSTIRSASCDAAIRATAAARWRIGASATPARRGS